jgi:hypothetical protein
MSHEEDSKSRQPVDAPTLDAPAAPRIAIVVEEKLSAKTGAAEILKSQLTTFI